MRGYAVIHEDDVNGSIGLGQYGPEDVFSSLAEAVSALRSPKDYVVVITDHGGFRALTDEERQNL